ncbi:GDP-mannose 4,6-dehydratase [Microcoleus sp. FACHB-SPT15]|uniref:GDP-mannose 4,6-dehydratase n=1 Tax=Microcoleus sp. FACHB-SPT15 TaxID=2692830 RepID=UPI001785D43B|nr:GDP-mannose 4,6-dehydratase [Microcoleus sp. FACHB-SPT15]MBD1805855.1 GDP-mannose 4,6-dehydratase [Microcoleus sp. FACHB-SPT15]
MKMQSTSSLTKPTLGVLEWFRPGEYEQVERVLADLKTIGIQHLRTGVSWADWHTTQGQEWYTWLLKKLGDEINVLPCFHYTPPSLGIAPKTAAPPRRPKDYADFIDLMITRFGDYFEWLELWNEPNNLNDWDWRLDPEWQIFSEMIGSAAYWAQRRGKKTVLAGMSPVEPHWLARMCDRGILAYIDAIGIHGFPGTWEFDWQEWSINIEKVQVVLERYGLEPELWLTETGFSTWKHDEHGQLKAFLQAIAAPVDRVYWYSLYDLHPDLSTQDGFHADERHYHMGIKHPDGTPKLLYRLWATGGLDAVQEIALSSQLSAVSQKEHLLISSSPHPLISLTPNPQFPVLITGGAGFIGTNLAHRLLSTGQPVLLFDNLSRHGVEQNLRWLQQRHGDLVQIEVADVRDRYALRRALQNACMVFHFAAQVAVTSSLKNPLHDFEVNATGTLNLLEEMRSLPTPPPLVFTSTNKVYGGLQNVPLRLNHNRYEPIDDLVCRFGISEDRALNFYSPYGCSKGAADQYVIDYARTFGLPAVVFRMSCIYGPHQFGTEDQGWVAHFLIRAIEEQPITLYGDGMQVRDILFVEDLVDAFLLAQENIHTLSGQAFNIGGGNENTTSLIEFIDLIGEVHGKKPRVYFDSWRPGDQRYYVSDSRKFQTAIGWTPSVNLRQGVSKLYQWLLERSGQRLAVSGQLFESGLTHNLYL